MKTRSILVRFPGYPKLENLLPDAHLASWAACLQEAGHECEIVDHGTLDAMARQMPVASATGDSALIDLLAQDGPMPPLGAFYTYWQARHLDRQYTARQEAAVIDAANALVRSPRIHMIVFKIDSADEVRPAMAMASRMKCERPDVLLCAAGPFVEVFASLLCPSYSAIDVWVVGDSERTLTRLANVRHMPERWSRIHNLVYALPSEVIATERNHEMKLADLPPPAYDPETYPALAGSGKMRLFSIEDSRGVLRSRAAHAVPGTPLQLKPAAAVANEMWRLATQYGARTFHFPSPHTPARHVHHVAREIAASGIKTTYSRAWTPDTSDPGVYDALAASGCQAIGFRVWSGSQRLLNDYFGAGFGVTEAEQALRRSKAAGMFTAAEFVYPTPADDYHTEDETLRMIRRTSPDAVRVDVPDLLPLSDWYENPERYGYSFGRKTYLEHVLRCRARFPLPPHRWPSLPYRLGRWSGSEVIRKQEQLILAIKESSVVVYLSEVIALLSRITRAPGQESEFQRELRYLLPSGDMDGMARLVNAFNEQGCVPAKPGGLRPFVPSRAAVGN